MIKIWMIDSCVIIIMTTSFQLPFFTYSFLFIQNFFPLINFQGVAIIKLTFQRKRQLRLEKSNKFPYIHGTREWQSLNQAFNHEVKV